MKFDVAAVQKVQSQINKAIWICAGIAMSASAIAGITGFWNLQQDGWGLASGFLTSLTVDVALWVALTSDRLVESIGLSPDGPWARTVRWGTAVMSIFLNVLAAVLSPLKAAFKILLIIIHAFAPLIMVGLAELRAETGRKLAKAERAALAEQQRIADQEARRVAAELAIEEERRRAADTPVFTPSERISPSFAAVGRTSSSLPESLGGAQATTNGALPAGKPEPSPALVASPGLSPVMPLRPASAPMPTRRQSTASPRPGLSARRSTLHPASVEPSRSPVRAQVFAWLDANYGPGVTVTTLVDALGGSRDTYKKLLGEWRKLNEERVKEAAS